MEDVSTNFRYCENSKQCKKNPILSSPHARVRVCIVPTVRSIRVCNERSTKHGKERIWKKCHIPTALILQKVEHQWQTCHWRHPQNTVLCNVTPHSLGTNKISRRNLLHLYSEYIPKIAGSFETSIRFYQTKRCNIPKDITLHFPRHSLGLPGRL